MTDGPVLLERSQESEVRRAELLELFRAAEMRVVAVAAVLVKFPPHRGAEALREALGSQRDVLRSWVTYLEREDRFYGTGWPHDEDRTRLPVGLELARAWVEGLPPSR